LIFIDQERNFTMSPKNLFESQAIIKVIGVGGAGCNAVNRMVESGVHGVQFIAMNTDRQALDNSLAPTTLPLGVNLTRGLGTGGDPNRGEASARESEREIIELLEGSDMVFVTAGMGGGTGTGAAPIVAELAQRLGILTIGVVTKPFTFEGPKRRKLADNGTARMQESVDTLIKIPNDRLLKVVDRSTSLQAAFQSADDVLRQGVQGISDIILKPGMINVDFADVRAVMKNAGVALMGLGYGVGDHRARYAAESAANSPMLETSIVGAKRLLVNVTAGPDFSLGEAQEAMEYIAQLCDAEEADIFMGHVLDPHAGDEVFITLLAAGMDPNAVRPVEREVFESAGIPNRTPSPEPVQPEVRNLAKPLDLDDIDFDIPTFLRRQRSNS